MTVSFYRATAVGFYKTFCELFVLLAKTRTLLRTRPGFFDGSKSIGLLFPHKIQKAEIITAEN